MWLIAKYTIAGSQLSYATVPFLCPLLCREIWLCTNTFCIVKNFGGMKVWQNACHSDCSKTYCKFIYEFEHAASYVIVIMTTNATNTNFSIQIFGCRMNVAIILWISGFF